MKYQLILKLLPPVLSPYKGTSTNPPISWHHKLSALGAGHHLTPTLQFQSLQMCRGGTPTSLPFPFTLQTPSSLPFLAMLHRLPPPPLLRHLHTPTPPSFSALRSAFGEQGIIFPPPLALKVALSFKLFAIPTTWPPQPHHTLGPLVLDTFVIQSAIL